MKTADVCDQYHEELQICEPMFRSFGGKQQFSGPIATVKVFKDNVLVREALETVPEGSVLVVDGGGSKQCALMGDRLGEIAVSRGLAGVIINGCVRDSAELSQMEIGVMALAPMPLKSRKEGKGDRDIPVTFGGVNWEPGHYVYADEDGIVVSPRSLEF
ncbi:regulator of ribonuclease activity A [Melghirimyces thermohalophilus]|uniref:4-hydroxy-4-methyl-2-oxoglutarate aldolase n=1 Tax=Melghirimyces thermohalophilus TaxID=1236220 RepID=A0A1G6K3A5_9BACL|nr:ribonuclease E activity regulator RraA [Melghirimyces thermohalophilus]SDC24756.1 regulator of ribonuclease activity A [Melghirimyces thermohalophilus]